MYVALRKRRKLISKENCRKFITKKRRELVRISIVARAAFNITKKLKCLIEQHFFIRGDFRSSQSQQWILLETVLSHLNTNYSGKIITL